nr:hypothetical protein [Ktedonobacteraceae bacterium]
MNKSVRFGTILGGAILTLLWVFCFLFIKPTLAIDFGGGVLFSLQLTAILIGLLIIVLYHVYNRPNPDTTKLSLTTDLTIAWLSLILFYPFNPPANASSTVATTWPGGAVGFFALIGGLGIVVLWVHFFADEIA